MISFLRYGLPLVIWMVVIFSASADTQSTEHTSRFLVPFLRWLNPSVSAETIDTVRWLVRKSAHMAEYAMLAWLAWRALHRPKRHGTRLWSGKTAGAALGIAVLYAATDEMHQRFVPNRTGSIQDVGIDAAGAVLGMCIVWLFYGKRMH